MENDESRPPKLFWQRRPLVLDVPHASEPGEPTSTEYEREDWIAKARNRFSEGVAAPDKLTRRRLERFRADPVSVLLGPRPQQTAEEMVFDAIYLFGAVWMLKNHYQIPRGIGSEVAPVLRIIWEIQVEIQQRLTAAWPLLSLKKRDRFMRTWTKAKNRGMEDEFFTAFAQEWIGICIGAIRVATAATAFSEVPGEWKLYLPPRRHDLDHAIDLIAVGRARLNGEERQLGFLIQVKGGPAHNIWVIQDEQDLLGFDTFQRQRLMEIWDIAAEEYNDSAYRFIPALITVAYRKDKDAPIHRLRHHGAALRRAIQKKFAKTTPPRDDDG